MKALNIEEQVLKNANDIKRLQSGITITYSCSLDDLEELTIEENIGKYVLVTNDETGEKFLYVITKRINGSIYADSLGRYPAVVKGETGETGETGARGNDGTGIYGCSANLPAASAYKEGDFYFLYDGDVFKKIGHSWVRQTNIKGPMGPVGLNGTVVVANPIEEPTDVLYSIEIDGTYYELNPLNVDTLAELLEGSSSIVVDYNEGGDKIQIRLDQDIIDEINSKLDASKAAVSSVGGLVIPNVAPTSHALVGVDNTNGQEMIGIGDGLTVEGGKLKATNSGDYVEKTDSPSTVYVVDELGRQANWALDDEQSFGGVPTRNLDNDILLPLTPSSDNAAVCKSYVDSRVSANPVGDATETLSKLKIGNTIYSAGGGGGETHLYRHRFYYYYVSEKAKIYFEIYTSSNTYLGASGVWNYLTGYLNFVFAIGTIQIEGVLYKVFGFEKGDSSNTLTILYYKKNAGSTYDSEDLTLSSDKRFNLRNNYLNEDVVQIF